MSDFIWPSDIARAENDELNRVCEELSCVMDEADTDRKMADIYRKENVKLQTERDAWQRMSEQYKREAYALAAHVKRLRKDAEWLCYCLAHDYSRLKKPSDGAFLTLQDTLAANSETSLARQKLLWQAEALSEMIAAIPFSESLARDMLKHRRDELRRQAEGGE